jgi:hypothetical protein
MADISIQFHALPEELRDFVKECVTDFGLHILGIRFPPYQAVELAPRQLDAAFADSSPYDELAFTLRRPALPRESSMDAADANPDALWLAIGKRTETELRESHLSARTDNDVVLAVWKKIAKRLKGMTEKGAVAMQPKTGLTAPARWHRYTSAAKELEARGVRMLTITGIILNFGQVPNEKHDK